MKWKIRKRQTVMSLTNPLNNAFGLDIGDRTFKLVQVNKDPGKKISYRLQSWSSVDVPEGVMERGEIIDVEKGTECLIELLKNVKGKLRGKTVVACLPEARSFVKVIEIDYSTDHDMIRDEVSKEIKQNIPLPVEDIYYDWHPIEGNMPDETATKPEEPTEKDGGQEDDIKPTDEPDTEIKPDDGPKKMRIMLAAAPRTLVDSYVQMIEAAGLAPIALEIEATAIARAMVPMNEPPNRPLGILDIGATRSSLIVCDDGAMQMSISVPLSGNELTKIISEKLSIDLADAELVKIECGLDAHRCEDKMWNILLPIIDDISNKIRNALRFYRIGFQSGKKIEKLVLCGGGANFRDIDTVLSRKLTIKVKRGNSLVNVSKLPKNFPEDGSLSYTTAIGLALRASDENGRFRHSFRI